MLTHWCVCACVCFNTRNLTFNTCSYKVWLTWYVITWKVFFVCLFFLKRRKSRGTECYSRLFSMRLREKEHACRTESCSWQDRACCNQCRLQPSLFFSFPLFLAQQHPVVKQPTCLPGWRLFSTSLLGIFSICASVSSVWNGGMKQNAWLVIITQQVINVWKW